MKMPEVDDAFKKVIHGINSWYISDYQSYKASIVKNDNAKYRNVCKNGILGKSGAN
jgi:hypothetical protein